MKLTVWAGDACIFRRIRISLTAPPFVNASRDIFWYLRSSWICFTGNSLPASALWRVLQRSFPPSARCAALSNLFSKSISPCSFLLSPRNEQFENRRTCSFVEPIFNFLKLDRVEDIGGGTCNDISTCVIKRRVFKHTNENKWKWIWVRNVWSRIVSRDKFDNINKVFKKFRSGGGFFEAKRKLEEVEIDGCRTNWVKFRGRHDQEWKLPWN